MNRSIKITSLADDALHPIAAVTVEDLKLQASDWVPNHPRLPVLIYRNALDAPQDRASAFETLFEEHGWQGTWRDGIFDYQHYHTGAHEVLGIAEGRGRVQLGGPTGPEIGVAAGDCLILPAGTGHMRIEASRDFLVVGAYPPGQEADIRKEAPTEAQLDRISRLPLPPRDPLYGEQGPLLRHWHP